MIPMRNFLKNLKENSNMCGLVGIIGTISILDETIFAELLYADKLRGKDSTGVFSINTKGNCLYHKAAMSPEELQATDEYRKVEVHGHTALIGHNRAATKGVVTNTNSHPFVYGGITLIHNGTLRSMNGLENVHAVDSACIAHALSVKPTLEVLASLDGAYALIWHDSSDNSINIAKNNERSLFQLVHHGNVYIASDELMLRWICKRNRIVTNAVAVPALSHHKTYLKTGATVSTKFTEHVGWGTTYYDGYTQGVTRHVTYKRAHISKTDKKTLHKWGLAVEDKVTFNVTLFLQFGNSAYGRATGIVRVRGVPIQATSIINADIYETTGILTGTVDGVSLEKGKPTLRLTEVNKFLTTSLTKKDDVVTINAGEEVSRVQYEEDLAQGCSICNEDFSEVEKNGTDIEWWGVGFPVHKRCNGV